MSPSLSAVTATREHFIHQLVYFDEQYPAFFDNYLSGLQDAERALIEKSIRRYTDTLVELLEKEDDALFERLKSIVLIGSRANVYYEEDGFEESFTVVYPSESDPDMNRISFLSPIGRQLLFATPDRPLTFDVPSGKLQVVVREIRYAYIGGFSTG
ncbi:GreA/GreB family elongation factor [Paenibacillus antri]|uniref:GreA/GreB family elongation factor n=1 Tax=Paenibacillus antri TaxID=2582848 RepID=A0A5R9G200_9BACL|nr:GreA/GreB family elongation factor [Paenibacillus antri]TLS48326.1 GreA/GreB family elongation factor [Paenibacillus antri]